MGNYFSTFESIGSRLGFRVDEENRDRLSLVWQGGRFPGFLCLGVSLALLFLSVPITLAIHLQGLDSSASSLWYFPVMNLITFAVAIFLLFLKRTIIIDHGSRRIYLSKRSLFRRNDLSVDFRDIVALRRGTDMIYSGPALAGSTAGQTHFPAASLRLVLANGETVLLDRGGERMILDLTHRLNRFLDKPITSE